MSKTYKGHELLKAIEDKEIKQGAKIEISNNTTKLIFDGYTLRWENSLEIAWVSNFTNNNITFELIEEEEIDIQAIEEVNHYDIISVVEGKTVENINNELAKYSMMMNDLAKAIKQLDKRTRKEKE